MNEPGTRCDGCGRRIPKPRRNDSPEVKRIVAVLPPERAEVLSQALDILQEVTGYDSASYPRGTLLEAMLVVAGLHHREELIEYAREFPQPSVVA